MKIRLANEKDKVGVYKAIGYCFNSDKASIENNIKNGPYNKYEQFIVTVDDNDEVISTFSIIPYTINFEGQKSFFGGVAGVSSLPEYRGQGNIASMFSFALKYMKDNDMVFSGLGPFSFPFYRQFGYEWCYTWQLVSIPLSDLKSFKPAYKYMEINKENCMLFENFRNQCNIKINGPIIREKHIIEEKWNHYINSNSRVYAALNENDEIVSTMVYQIINREIKVSEMYFKDEISRQYLLNFIYRHRSSADSVELILTANDEIRNILPSPRIKYWHWPNKMGRVVIVDKALSLMNIEEEFDDSYTIKVNDNLASWNNQTFKISCKNHKLIVKISDEPIDFEVSIQNMSQLILGHLDGKMAIDLNLITVNNNQKVKMFKKTFTKRTTMLWQEF